MLKVQEIEIHCMYLERNHFFLYGTPASAKFSPEDWILPLFQWHQGSFYGTNLKEHTLKMKKGKRTVSLDGVVIDALDVLELFGTEPFNSFVQWEFNDFAQTLLSVAPVIYEEVNAKNFVPDFAEWKKGPFRWKVPERVWNEFLPDFWEGTIGENSVVDAGEEMTLRDFVQVLFHDGVEAFIARTPRLAALWEERKKVLEDALANGEDLSRYFDEKRFLEWAGMAESDLPFTFGLELKEPVEDGGMWTLSMILRNRKKPDTFAWLITEEKERGIPNRWIPYLKDIFAEQLRMVKMFPHLADEETLILLENEGVSLDLADVELANPLDADGNPKSCVSVLAEQYMQERPISLVKQELFEEEAWRFLTEDSEKLLLLGIEILLPSWWEALKSANVRLKARVGDGPTGPSFVGLDALMDFEWRVSVNNVDLTEEEFRELMAQNRRLVKIGGRWMRLDPSFIKQVQAIMEKAEKQGMRVSDFIEQHLLYGDGTQTREMMEDEDNDNNLFARIQIELHPRLKNFVNNLTSLSDLPEEAVPEEFHGELRPYQQKGMNWLYFLRKYRFGAVLADDMGLGKTIQLISYLLLVKKKEPEAGPALIICPTSVLGNWQRELERFAPSLKVYLHYGSSRLKGDDFAKGIDDSTAGLDDRPVDVVLTTYGLSHLDLEELSSVSWGTIVLDEAQNIKNASTKQSRAIRKLKGTHHIALTGTPMENRLTELWSIFDFINKGYLGSRAHFQERFVIPIERERDQKKIEELRNLIRPFLLRRTKRDEEVALNLPDKLEQKAYCPLTPEQASLYEQIVKDTFEMIRSLSGFERKGHVLRLLGILKQLCNHPNLYLKDYPSMAGKALLSRSTKMEKLAEIVDNILEQGESGLVFTQYIGMGEIITRVLQEEFNIEVPFLNGSMPKQKRDALIEQFQKGEFPILLLSLKAGGTGLNLTAASHVIHYDRWWNPAVENQATDRAYRIGQTKFVHVHKFIATGTLEEKIDAMLEKKQSLTDEIIQSDGWLADMSDDELYNILKLD